MEKICKNCKCWGDWCWTLHLGQDECYWEIIRNSETCHRRDVVAGDLLTVAAHKAELEKESCECFVGLS